MSDARKITLTINGEKKELLVSPNERLLPVLRRAGYKGVKEGCNEGTCGACTVILNGRAVYACILFAFQADGAALQTIEGAGDFDRPHPFQQALVEEGGVQCGYCTPGMVMAAKALLDAQPHPSDEEIREQMDGNLCRCTGYEKIWRALQKVAAQG